MTDASENTPEIDENAEQETPETSEASTQTQTQTEPEETTE